MVHWRTCCSIGSVGEFLRGVSDVSILLVQSLFSTLLLWCRQLQQFEDLTVTETQTQIHVEVELKERCSDKHSDLLERPHWPVVDLVRRWEAFCGPVEEAVDKDEPGKTRPHPHDHLEGHACIVDQLGRRHREENLSSSLLNLFMFYGHLGAAEQAEHWPTLPCKVTTGLLGSCTRWLHWKSLELKMTWGWKKPNHNLFPGTVHCVIYCSAAPHPHQRVSNAERNKELKEKRHVFWKTCHVNFFCWT